jgi:serine/threonine-protein kinase
MASGTEQGSPNELVGTCYCLGKRLAEGSAGTVYEAEHAELGDTLVVKLLRLEMAECPTMAARFRAEATILARLGPHPNIVRVVDFGVASTGRPFLVMERLPGRTLREELSARGPLPVGDAIDDMRQALAGLDVAHRAGVVHRDVKLGNLFACAPDAEGHRAVKILDFGVAKLLDKLAEVASFHTEEGTLVGTPAFMAPEQALGSRIDARTDVYGAAVCLYRLVAGRGPFASPDRFEVLRMHAFKEPPPPSRFATQPIPEALDQLLVRALAKDPGARPPSARAFAAELEGIQASLAAPLRGGARGAARSRFFFA